MDRRISRIVLGFAAVLAAGPGGCAGEKKVDVAGRVTYNGTPLDRPGGEIVFVGSGGTQAVAAIQPDGTYRAVGVVTGPNRVAVYYRTGEIKKEKLLPGKAKKVQPTAPSSPFLTPSRYASVETSDLSVDVQKDTVFDTDLTGPPIR
jgi:hypothetical protein